MASSPKKKNEQPPDLTDDDEKILDRIWRKQGTKPTPRPSASTPKSPSKKK